MVKQNETEVVDPLDLPPVIEPIVTEIDLPGEPDRAFVTASGLRLRVKVKESHRKVSRIRPNVAENVKVLETCRTYTISLSELDDDNQVKSIDGSLLIHDGHEITVTPEALAVPGFNFDDAVMDIIEREAIRIEGFADAQKKLAKSLKDWGFEA